MCACGGGGGGGRGKLRFTVRTLHLQVIVRCTASEATLHDSSTFQ